MAATEIPPVSVVELKDRTIVVLHFLKDREPPLKNTNKYCNLEIDLKFNLDYRPIHFGDPINFTTNAKGRLLNKNDMIIIYINPFVFNGQMEDKKIRIYLLEFLAQDITKFLDVPCVLFYTVFMSDLKFFSFFKDNYFAIASNLRKDPHLLYDFTSKKIKILNVYYDDRIKNLRTDIHDGQRILVKGKLTPNELANDKLECEWWLSDELLKAFGCGRNRLKQHKSTCYLTAVINGLLLSDSARSLCIEAMNASAKGNPALQAIIKEPILKVACPSFKEGRKEFFYNILYNIVCENKRSQLRGTKLDIFIDASAKHFSLNTVTDVTHETYGQNGEPISTIINLLFEMQIDGFVALNAKRCAEMGMNRKFHNFCLLDRTMNWTKLNQSFSKNENKTAISEDDEITLHERKCFVYLPQFPMADPLKPVFSNVFTTSQLPFSSTTFLLCFGIISFQCRDKVTKKTMSHAVLGLICNDIYIIYDSNKNQFIDFDWTTIINKDQHAKIIKIFSDMYSEDYENFDFFKVDLAFYINKIARVDPPPSCNV
jgi:hypothetical protein